MCNNRYSALPNDIIAMTIEIESNKGHFAHQVGEPALVMLKAYNEFGIVSRTGSVRF